MFDVCCSMIYSGATYLKGYERQAVLIRSFSAEETMDDVPIDNFDYVDHTCDTCVGITYYDKAMKGRNETFLCFGFRSTIDVNNHQELKKYEMQSAKEFDSFSCVGEIHLLVSVNL
jgi:hypothetical protein